MSTKLYAEILERNLEASGPISANTLYYLSNNLATNKRILIKDQLDGRTKVMEGFTYNNTTAKVDEANNFLTVCLSPKNIISCAGSTSYCFIGGSDGLYTVEVNGHIVISNQSMNAITTTNNLFMRDLGFNVISIPNINSVLPNVYCFIIQDSVNVLNARVRITQNSDVGNLFYISPSQITNHIDFDTGTLPTLTDNITFGTSSREVTFCLSSELLKAVCHNFGNPDYVLNGLNINDRTLNVFPDIFNNEPSLFHITINGEVAEISYSETPSMYLDVNGTVILNKVYILSTESREYQWDVTDYSDISLPVGVTAPTPIRAWRLTSPEDLKEEDVFVFCINKYFDESDPGMKDPFTVSPYGNAISGNVNNTRFVRTRLNNTHYSYSVHGKVTFLPWLNIISPLGLEYISGSEAIPYPTYDGVYPNTVMNVPESDDIVITYPYHDPISNPSYALIEISMPMVNVDQSKIPATENFVTVKVGNIEESYNKQNFTNRFVADTTRGLYVSTVMVHSTENKVVTVTVDYDGSQRHDYITNTATINVISNITPGLIPSTFDLLALNQSLKEEFESGTLTEAKLDGLNVQVHETTMVGDVYRLSANSSFGFNIDGEVWGQSFLLRFLPDIEHPESIVEFTINGVEYTRSDIIPRLVSMGSYRYFLVNVDNLDNQHVVMAVNLDYDGNRDKYTSTVSDVDIVATPEAPPPIPLFAFSRMMARIEITDANTYFFGGYRYMQFKVPVYENSLVKIDPVLGVSNYTVRPLAIDNPEIVLPITSRSELYEFTGIEASNSIWAAELEDKYTLFGFRDAGEAVFQIRVPLGISGNIYFAISPISNNANLLSYNNELMTIDGQAERLPSLTIDPSTISAPRYNQVNASNEYQGAYMFEDLLMPGTAIAFNNLGQTMNFSFIDSSVRYIDLYSTVNNVVAYRNTTGKKGTSHLYVGDFVNAANNTQVGSTSMDLSSAGLLGTSLSDSIGVIFRTLDNRLLLITYNKLNNIAVNVNKIITLLSSTAMSNNGYSLTDGIRVVVRSTASAPSMRLDITKPYEVTYDELTTFASNQTFEINSFIAITDVFGFDQLTSN